MNFLFKTNCPPLFEKSYFLSEEETKKLTSLKKNQQESTVFFKNGQQQLSQKIRSSFTSWINLNDVPDILQKINFFVDEINNINWRFKINYLGESSIVSYLNPKDNYNWHTDWNSSVSSCNRKISVLIQLSDPSNYQGCRLQIKMGKYSNHSFTNELGSILIFPSFLLHRATKLISGERDVLVMWYHGDSFV
jgi:PKHD-type hydroxylase